MPFSKQVGLGPGDIVLDGDPALPAPMERVTAAPLTYTPADPGFGKRGMSRDLGMEVSQWGARAKALWGVGSRKVVIFHELYYFHVL